MTRPLHRCADCGGKRHEPVTGKRRGRCVPLCPRCKQKGAVPPPPMPKFLQKALEDSARGRAHLRRLEERPTNR